MGIREDFANYINKDGYSNPFPVSPDAGRSCDNSTLYTSEMYIIFEKQRIATEEDKNKWEQLISDSMQLPGLLARYPGAFSELDSPDNMIGVLAASQVLKKPKLAKQILFYGLKHFGNFNNPDPGQFTFTSMLWRQPQLIAASVASSFPSWKNPLHYLARLAAFPLFLIAAFVIFISCINADKSDSNSRLLGWLLIQSVVPVSLMCKFASLFWFHRLDSVYGKAEMGAVAGIYFQPQGNNPYQKYWVTE
jgi:hypothetical protein